MIRQRVNKITVLKSAHVLKSKGEKQSFEEKVPFFGLFLIKSWAPLILNQGQKLSNKNLR